MGSQAHFEVFEGGSGVKPEWFWRLKAGNGEIVAQSEAYTTKEHAHEGADTVKREAAYAVTADVRGPGTS